MADEGVEMTAADLLKELMKSEAQKAEITSRYLKLKEAVRVAIEELRKASD